MIFWDWKFIPLSVCDRREKTASFVRDEELKGISILEIKTITKKKKN